MTKSDDSTREAVARAVGAIFADHGQKAARYILREAVIRIGLAEGLPSGIQAAREVADDLDKPDLFN